jgi:hypothetical protein
MTVVYTVSGDTFIPEKPRVRLEKLGVNDEGWDVAPDGGVAAVTPVGVGAEVRAPREHTVIFLENFFDELRRQMPLAK